MAKALKLEAIDLGSRQHEAPVRAPRTIWCKILIVCEGERTEPNYFHAFGKIPRGPYVFEIKTEGGKINTIDVVNKAIELRDEAIKKGTPYDSVWAVFDKDDFSVDRFNGAINRATTSKINCAWSNEAFELWYLFHFHNRVTAMKRDEYKKAISDAVKKEGGANNYKYAKNDSQNHRIINQYGSQDNAIKWAKKCHEQYSGGQFHIHNPCTTVYQLVLQLIGRDEKFNDMVSKIVDPDPPKKCK